MAAPTSHRHHRLMLIVVFAPRPMMLLLGFVRLWRTRESASANPRLHSRESATKFAYVQVELGHAEGAAARLTALGAMSRLLTPGGRLVITSRNWELVRSAGSRVDVRDRLIRRNGRDAVVSYYWHIEQQWDQEHLLEIVVARIEPDGTVRACSERLSIWPYRYEDLVVQLRRVGLTVRSTTFDADSDGYVVVACRDEAPGTSESAP